MTMTKRVKGAVRGVLWPSQHENVAYNRHMWDRMARKWSPEQVPVEGRRSAGDRIEVLGDEWGDPESVEQILERFVYPYADRESVVGEIGSGGGRIALRLAPRVRELWCFDISKEMLRHARKNLAEHPGTRFALLDGPRLPPEHEERFDLLYAFDVFVHLDLHTQWKYFREFARTLKPGGRAFVHTANLRAPRGWEHFAAQDRFEIRGHYFVVPELVQLLGEHAGLVLEDESTPEDGNFYLRRDYLALFRKPV